MATFKYYCPSHFTDEEPEVSDNVYDMLKVIHVVGMGLHLEETSSRGCIQQLCYKASHNYHHQTLPCPQSHLFTAQAHLQQKQYVHQPKTLFPKAFPAIRLGHVTVWTIR